MEIKPNFDFKKWCEYDEKHFKYVLKPNAPKEIQEKFEEWQNSGDMAN